MPVAGSQFPVNSTFLIILAIPFLKFRRTNLVLGVAVILFGVCLQKLSFGFPWLLWLGFIPSGFYTFDYFPIFPWFGIFLIGIFFCNLLYANGKRTFRIPDLSGNRIIKFLSLLGRKSLYIYLLHQPIIFAFLYIFIL